MHSIIVVFYLTSSFSSSSVSSLYDFPRSISRYLPRISFAPEFIPLYRHSDSLWHGRVLVPCWTPFQCLEWLSVIYHLMSMSFEFVISNYTSGIIYYVFAQKFCLVVRTKMTSGLLGYYFICCD
jgi:hypothetical protein